MHAFRLGTVLGTGFRVWARNLLPFLLITTLFYAPLLLWGIALVEGESSHQDLTRFAYGYTFSELLTRILVSTGLVYGVVKELSGEHAPFLRCLRDGLARFFPALGVAILTVLAIGLGLIALLVPGVIVMCILYVATQVAVLERPGLIGALARSGALTAGHRWKIFAILLLLEVIRYVILLVIEQASSGMSFDSYRDDLRFGVYTHLGLGVVIASLSSVMACVAYYYLRLEKEGTSAGELARVFE